MSDTYQSKYTGAQIDERLELAESISPHIAKQLNTETGIHGIRYWQDKLEYNDGESWVEIETGGGGGSFVVKGLYANLSDLIAAHPTGEVGDAYAVGSAEDNDVYIWSIVSSAWVNIGPLRGEKGDPGEDGVDGRGIVSVTRTSGTGAPGTTDTYTITYTDSTTSTFNVYNGADGLGAGDKRTARFVVGTSTAGWTAADCDYLCDGTADQVEINAAITALPATGGEIVILDGTYNITAKINVNKNNVSIKGNGNATILKRMYNSSTAEGVITLTGRSGCKITDLQVDGNGASYTGSSNNGIYLESSSNNTITGNACNNNSRSGIYLTSSSNNTITGNACNNNSSNGIFLNVSSNNTVTSNTCNNNNAGIYISSSSNNNTVTGNTYNNNNYGIYIRSSNNTVTGNACNNNGTGIFLLDSSNNTVTGNTCIRGTGLAGDYTTSQHTIRLMETGNKYNLIAMNNCMGKAVTNEGGTGNTLVNNKFDAT